MAIDNDGHAYSESTVRFFIRGYLFYIQAEKLILSFKTEILMKSKLKALPFLFLLTLLFVGCKKKEPVACFTMVSDGAVITVDADCSTDEESYTWDFGDGGTDSTKTATHTYSFPATYEVTLRVDGKDGYIMATQYAVVARECRSFFCTNDPLGGGTYCGTLQVVKAWCTGLNDIAVCFCN